MATPQGSTPDTTNEGVQDEHSLPNTSAEITDESQSSNEDQPQFFGTDEDQETDESQDDEQGDDSDDAPSQTLNTDDDTSSDESEDNSEDTDSVDPELAKWANSQNISLETPTEIKLAKRLRDTQKGFHEAKAESKAKFTEATNEITGGDQVTADTLKLARMEFFMDTPDAKALEGEMYDIALETRDSGDKAGFEYFQTPQGWRTLYRLAQAKNAEVQSEDSYKTGRKDERTNLAKKQQANTAKRAATNSAPTSSKMTEDKIANMTTAEYNKFRAENPSWDPFRG